MYSHLRTVSRTSRTGWDAARWRGSQPPLSISLKAKVCGSISLSTETSPGYHDNKTRAQTFMKDKKKEKNSLDGISVFFPLFCRPFITLCYKLFLSPLCLSPCFCWSARPLMPGSPHLQMQQNQTQYLSGLPCSIAARTLRFSSVAAAKLTVRRRESTEQSVAF